MRVINVAVKLAALRSKPTATGTPVFLPWGIDDPHELEKLVPGLRLVEALPFLTMPELVGRMTQSRGQGPLYRVLERCGWYRRSMLHLRYEF